MTSWIQCYEPNPRAPLRLFCLPFAGGTSAIYRGWGKKLSRSIEVVPLQPPGRGARLQEQPLRRVPDIVRSACDAIQFRLDRPYALFGHSLGGFLAFEITRELRRRGTRPPSHLLVSATPGPSQRVRRAPIHELPDLELIEHVERMGGTPAAVSGNAELMRLMLPALRADFEAYATYRYEPDEPVHCPLSVYGGLRDHLVTRRNLEGWRAETRADCSIRMIPGDHFYVLSRRELLLHVLSEDLARLLEGTHGGPGNAASGGRRAFPLPGPDSRVGARESLHE